MRLNEGKERIVPLKLQIILIVVTVEVNLGKIVALSKETRELDWTGFGK